MTAELTSPGAELYCPSCEQIFATGTSCPDDGTRLVSLTTPADPFVGRELDGRYTIIEKLGEGGMGAVYRARQHSMGREVAVKVLTPSLVKDPHSIKRFLREAKLASRLAHPNVVAVLDFGQATDGVFYLVMELVAGRTLHEVLARDGRLPLTRLVRIGAQICDALEGAHALPIIHRDLKPANVMLLATGRDLVKVLDFGLAKSLSVDASNTTMTGTGALLGTPTFMPPEVANGEFVDDRADLYSLGCMLYVMASGRPPFVSDSVPEMISMHGTMPAPPVTGVARPIAAVIDRLLRKDPAQRYPSAAAVREALEAAVDEIRRRGADADTDHTAIETDTLDEVLPSAPTLDSGAPQRPSDLRATQVFSSPDAKLIAGAVPPSMLAPPPAPRPPDPRYDTTLGVGTSGSRRGLVTGLAALVVLVVGLAVFVASRPSTAPSASTPTAPAAAVVPGTDDAADLGSAADDLGSAAAAGSGSAVAADGTAVAADGRAVTADGSAVTADGSAVTADGSAAGASSTAAGTGTTPRTGDRRPSGGRTVRTQPPPRPPRRDPDPRAGSGSEVLPPGASPF